MKWVAAWDRFWFEADGREQLRLLRTLVGWILFFAYLIRSLDLDLFYGEQGIVSPGALPELLPMEYRLSIFHYLTGRAALWIGNGVYLLSLLAMGLGVRSRMVTVIAWALHLSFVHRNMSVAYGVDTISCFYLLFLCISDQRDAQSYRPGDWRSVLGSVAFRLCQLQLCIIYGYSGLKKLKGMTWWSGDALWSSLAQSQMARWDFSWLAHFPLLLTTLTFVTLLWEIYFPALVWRSSIRGPLLAFGVLLHLGIAVALSIPFFAMMMVAIYVTFLDQQQILEITEVASRLKKRLKSFQVPQTVSE